MLQVVYMNLSFFKFVSYRTQGKRDYSLRNGENLKSSSE